MFYIGKTMYIYIYMVTIFANISWGLDYFNKKNEDTNIKLNKG